MTDALLNGKKIVYIATRLFNIYDKISGNILENAVYKTLKKCAKEENKSFAKYPLYLPFRDTNEDQLLEEKDAFKIIYEADIARLNNVYALIAFLDNPSKDDGICMEIGYVFANNNPIIILSTDIQYYRIDKSIDYHSDPIIHRMISRYIYMPFIPESKLQITNDCKNMEQISMEYIERLKTSENSLFDLLDDSLVKLYYNYDDFLPLKIESWFPHKQVCVDIVGGKYEWARDICKYIISKLDETSISYYTTDRFNSNEPDLYIRGEKDIGKLLSSDILVTCVDGSETDAGSAALIGMAKRLKKTIILYYSSTCDIVEGESSCLRNLMIELSADCICTSYRQISDTVKKYINKQA